MLCQEPRRCCVTFWLLAATGSSMGRFELDLPPFRGRIDECVVTDPTDRAVESIAVGRL